MIFEELIIEAQENGISVLELPLESSDGRNKGNRIAIRKNIPTLKEKKCVLAEELGHYELTVGNILNQDIVENRKQEYRARVWSYNKLVGLNGIISAFKNKCTNLYEIAEYLDVTEEFLLNSIQHYNSKYGLYTTIGKYIIYFEPSLTVVELF